jgi:NAD(P)-dependent dehydrogenase (short-subunit alcohol dehydrogenase family)
MTSRGWSISDVPCQTGRVAIVTGSTSGLGLETARVLAMRGALVIIASRSEMKARRVMCELEHEDQGAQLEFHHLDVSNLASVRGFAEWFLERDSALDLLINNAGIMMVPYGETIDGNEMQFGTNHLGHFALTGLVLPALERASSARVVTVSSIAHKDGDVDFDDLHFAGGLGYSPRRAYRRSKLANLLFALELDRRLDAADAATISVAAHPGVSDTSLADHLVDNPWRRLLRPIASRVLQGTAQGALPTLRAATDAEVRGGQYFGPAYLAETTGSPVLARPSMLARDHEAGSRLWQASELLTGVRFP